MSASRSTTNANIIKQSSLKSAPATVARTGVVKRQVVEANEEARRIIETAQAAAAAIHESAEHAALELREAAYREGLDAATLELYDHLLAARERRDAALVEVEADILRLAIKIAEKIIGQEIARDQTTLTHIVSTALRNARQHEMLTVRINPADFALIQTQRDQLDPSGRARFLDLVADPRVAHGGCLIESESGTIDAQLDTQLRVLERALLARTED
jgi:type III secretion protein L